METIPTATSCTVRTAGECFKRGESTKHGPLVHGPPLWTQSMDLVHQNMDRVHGPGPWTGSMDQVHGPPIFPTPKNTIENNKKIEELKWKKIHSNISNDNGNWTEWSSIWSFKMDSHKRSAQARFGIARRSQLDPFRNGFGVLHAPARLLKIVESEMPLHISLNMQNDVLRWNHSSVLS